MLSKQAFVEKLILRLDRLSKDEIRKHLSQLSSDIQKYHELLQIIPVGIVETFSDGKIALLNDAAENLLAIHNTDTKKISLSEMPDLVLADKLKKMILDKDHDIQICKTMIPREKVVQFKKIKKNDSDEYYFLITDVTQAELKSEYEDRRKLNQSILNLASGVAHEIGNPLNALQIHLGLLKTELQKYKTKETPKLDERVDTMQSEISRLDQIVKSFLKTVRRPALKFKHENLVSIIEDVLHFFKPEFEERHIVIKTDFKPREIAFLMDRDRIYEAMVNLLKNSLEAIGREGEISISLKQQNKIIFLRIKDNGAGISEEDLEHIFEAYFTTKTSGTGLGLVSVYQCVAEHGGRIEVKTKKNFGTTFTLILPMREPNKMLPSIE